PPGCLYRVPWLSSVRSVVDLDVPFIRELGPARDVVADVAAEGLGRHGHGLQRFRGEPLGELRVLQELVDFVVEPLDDRRRQVGRTDDAVPLDTVETLIARLGERRHVGQERVSPRARPRPRLYLSGPDVADRRPDPR